MMHFTSNIQVCSRNDKGSLELNICNHWTAELECRGEQSVICLKMLNLFMAQAVY